MAAEAAHAQQVAEMSRAGMALPPINSNLGHSPQTHHEIGVFFQILSIPCLLLNTLMATQYSSSLIHIISSSPHSAF